jgi:CheY-like chemotaxis protein
MLPAESVASRKVFMQHPGPLVLCVDDESVGLQVRRMILERAGYTVLTATNGPSALEVFSQQPIDAIVLDYAMPEMDGGEVAARMRSIKPDVPIILLSAFMALPHEVTQHVNIYMTKGEGAPSLIEKLDSLFPEKSLRPIA